MTLCRYYMMVVDLPPLIFYKRYQFAKRVVDWWRDDVPILFMDETTINCW